MVPVALMGRSKGLARVTPTAQDLEVAYGLVDPDLTREWVLFFRNASQLQLQLEAGDAGVLQVTERAHVSDL